MAKQIEEERKKEKCFNLCVVNLDDVEIEGEG